MTSKVMTELQKEEKELEEIKNIIISMKNKVLEKRPSHFSRRDIINAFFGSLIIGLTFVLKGALIQTALNISWYHLEAIVVVTLMILFVEIYFIGYSRVSDKSHRTFGQFMTKRMLTLYGISILVSFFLVYLFNVNTLVPGFYGTMKLVVILSMPSAIGAAVPNLLKQY